jgi:hypothetical protein
LKFAVTALFEDTEKLQVPVPEQSPVQLPKVCPDAGVAVSTRLVPCRYDPVQPVLPELPLVTVQLMAGETPAWLVMVPLPVPPPATLTMNLGMVEPAKLALTLRDCVMTALQVVPVPEQAPLQPVNVLPPWGLAVSVTWVFQP